MVKFHGVTFFSSKFMVADTLHFMTMLTLLAKNYWGTPLPGGMCASKSCRGD